MVTNSQRAAALKSMTSDVTAGAPMADPKYSVKGNYTYIKEEPKKSRRAGVGGVASSTQTKQETIEQFTREVTTGKPEVVEAPKPVTPKPVQRTEVQRVTTTPTKTQQAVGTFIQSSGQAVFGDQSQGRTIAGKGGAVQRGQKAFFGTVEGSRQIGQQYAGPIGGVVGGAIGGAVGFGLGAWEIGVSTPIRALGGFIQAEKGGGQIFGGYSKPIGQTYEVGGELIVGAASIKNVGKAPSALRSLDSLTKGSRSIYAPASTLQKTAGALETAGKIAKPIIQNPYLNIPLRFGGSLITVDAARTVTRKASGPEYERFASSQSGRTQLEKFYERVSKEQNKTLLGGIGGQVGFGFYGERASELGGISESKLKTIARESGVPEQFVKPTIQEYRTSQGAGLFAQAALLESTTETAGRYIIGGQVKTALTGTIPTTAKAIGAKAIYTTAKTVPAFAVLGAGEGFTSQIIADQKDLKIRGVQEIPKEIGKEPLKYARSTVLGAGSSILLGAPVVGFATYKTLRAGQSTLAKAGEKGTLGLGYAADFPGEPIGDTVADLFGPAEPSFRIRTISSIPTITQTTTRGGKASTQTFAGTPTTTSILEPTATATPISVPGITSPTSIYNPGTPTETSTPIPGDPTPSIGSQQMFPGTPTDSSTSIFVDESVSSSTTTPVSFSIPISTPSKGAPFPFFFPPGTGERGGSGRRRGGRLSYYNELNAAFGSLGRSLSLNNRKRTTRRRKK